MKNMLFLDRVTELQNHLSTSKYNVTFVKTFNKGETVLFKTVKEDKLILSLYFSVEWAIGIQLVFNFINGKFIFLKKGAFDFRDDKYNTPENNKILDSFIKEVENF
jgi:hypothetical protein